MVTRAPPCGACGPCADTWSGAIVRATSVALEEARDLVRPTEAVRDQTPNAHRGQRTRQDLALPLAERLVLLPAHDEHGSEVPVGREPVGGVRVGHELLER